MGKRGPAKTPTVTLTKRGSWRAKGRTAAPEPELEAPECPGWLSEKAKEVWDEIVPRLLAMGVLTEIDGNALGRYCDVFVLWQRESRFANADESAGRTYLAYNRLGTMLSRLEQGFGLTPASRPNLKAAPTRTEGKSRFFNAS